MAVEARSAPSTTPNPGQSLLRYALLATAATLGVSGAATAAVSMAAGFLVYQYARPRGQWGTDEPPDGLAEEVSFPSAGDGIRISGWYFRATDATPETPAPVVILCHGIWTGRRECLPLALRFYAAGYNVLTFDFRAHGLSDGRFTSVGHHETNDVLGAIEYVKARADVDRARIGVVGFSMGAAAAIQAAARGDDVAALVADSAYATFLDAAKYSFRLVTRVPHFPIAPMAMRWAKWLVNVDAGKLRPIDVIGQLSPRPVLIAHGALDEIVPVEHASRLFQAAGEPKELWIEPGAHHVGARDMDTDGYFERIQQFFGEAFSAVGSNSASPRPTS
ncbi:MAG: alpha/beta hydrolase [Chloroflexi bacterium]|nr:alpha/beta hydrolase [Chloroflexota bacterium]MBV9596652.1 alpha/beta hydrolase [Chloroflexota bacterium]